MLACQSMACFLPSSAASLLSRNVSLQLLQPSLGSDQIAGVGSDLTIGQSQIGFQAQVNTDLACLWAAGLRSPSPLEKKQSIDRFWFSTWSRSLAFSFQRSMEYGLDPSDFGQPNVLSFDYDPFGLWIAISLFVVFTLEARIPLWLAIFSGLLWFGWFESFPSADVKIVL